MENFFTLIMITLAVVGFGAVTLIPFVVPDHDDEEEV
ncbi:hypothetical protein Trad_2141 [Truepera radiovictrix DSM 17093]|jgi:hypothetical protein|uniref:Uncharacterized protein n=1 Tax=Truepera radiovictrix (strain DSM 17093 / CIP 108686 / LMG 22925 / RQ-24) TaxID=649638 RepID=D7CRS6_TRURR|nr:hypothetical protein Trad_2141 [Truepera radiovictrix DSM 17093]